MSMCHKAYAFNWPRFEAELLARLERALTTDDQDPVFAFVDEHLEQCRDPYEGEPLPADWRGLLETGDIQELADFALTAYYDPSDDWGVHEVWMHLDDELPDDARAALLGVTIGPTENPFDPGRMGSYCQTPAMACSSLSALVPYNVGALQTYVSLLRRVTDTGIGLYVTF